MRQRSHHRRDHRQKGNRHREIQREFRRDRLAHQRADEGGHIPRRANQDHRAEIVIQPLGKGQLRLALELDVAEHVGLIDHQVGRRRPLPQRRLADPRGERGGIHRHPKVNRQRGDEDHHHRGIGHHLLKRRKLRRPGDHQKRHAHGFGQVQPGLRCHHAEQQREGNDDEHKGCAVIEATQRQRFRVGAGHGWS